MCAVIVRIRTSDSEGADVTATQDAVEADRALKAKHRAMWALGDYPAVVDDLVGVLGPILVEAAGVRAGDRVLDVGSGSGSAAIPAALAGAQVIASDLTPELFERGRQAARSAVPRWNGARPTPRTCRSTTPSSTSCCRRSASCSPRTTRPALTSWYAYAVRRHHRSPQLDAARASSGRCSQP